MPEHTLTLATTSQKKAENPGGPLLCFGPASWMRANKKGHRRGRVYGLCFARTSAARASSRGPIGKGTMNGWEAQASTGSGQRFIVRICTEFTRVTR